MATTSTAGNCIPSSPRGGLLFLLPFCLAFTTSIFLLLYVSSTSKLYNIHPGPTHLRVNPPLEFSKIDNPQLVTLRSAVQGEKINSYLHPVTSHDDPDFVEVHDDDNSTGRWSDDHDRGKPSPKGTTTVGSLLEKQGKESQDEGVFHQRSLFMEAYKQMNKTLKIYVYPHNKTDPFANVLLDSDQQPGGNYASESYFKKSLFKSHFLTSDPSEADLFYLPFSIAGLRHDKRVGVGGIQKFVRNYITNISRSYGYWNRSGGADHFYVACHSVGRTAMEKAVEVKLNAIQVVCSSSYFLQGYLPHKDASIPQIWPRKGSPPIRSPLKRKRLAFYAGAMNSRVREFLVRTWKNDSDISVHQSRLKTPYSEALLGSKFCIHAKGFEVNTARIGDALYYGCVPVVLADHYDLPYADILNWNAFSVVISAIDIPLLKKLLQKFISGDGYLKLQRNVMRVQKHFQWHNVPVDYDAFHMVMYELWLRRSHVRLIS